MKPHHFKIPRRQKKCVHCACSFSEESCHYSLIKGEEQNPTREDYCERCFAEQAVLTDEVWGYWEISLKKPVKKLTPDQRALELFVEKQESGEKEWAYFLAFYLKRKKQLIQRLEIKKEGLLFFEEPLSSELYSIQECTLSAPTLLALTKEFLILCNPPELPDTAPSMSPQ